MATEKLQKSIGLLSLNGIQEVGKKLKFNLHYYPVWEELYEATILT